MKWRWILPAILMPLLAGCGLFGPSEGCYKTYTLHIVNQVEADPNQGFANCVGGPVLEHLYSGRHPGAAVGEIVSVRIVMFDDNPMDPNSDSWHMPVEPLRLDAYQPVEGVVRRALVAGLTFVDPDAYGGWDGACPGCDVDAEAFALLCREQGLQVVTAHNAQATADNLTAAARAAWQGMKAGDLFVFFVSGHGGQEPDASGDETDAQDETLCLWDGQFNDDVLGRLWEEAPVGLRVLFVTDTCNSGTNYKYRPRSIRKAIPRAYTGQLIHFGGCADGKSSIGGEQGGQFTTALIDGWLAGQSYRNWFVAAAKATPKNQTPYYAEYGNVTADYRDGAALK